MSKDGAPCPAVAVSRAPWRASWTPCGAPTLRGTPCRHLTRHGGPCYRHGGTAPPARIWTPAMQRRLEGLLEDGLTDREAAAKLGLTAGSISYARHVYGFARRDELLLTTRAAGAMLGFGPQVIVRWAQRGWLHGEQRTGRAGQANWFFREAAVMAFMEDADHWHRWDPDRIPAARLRGWAQRMRAGVRFLSVSEVARRLCCAEGTVSVWIRAGRLRGYFRSTWLVREDDLAGFTPPPIGQGNRKLTWEPCARCGDADGPVPKGNVTPTRRNGAPWGFDGRICGRCYQQVLAADLRQRKKAA